MMQEDRENARRATDLGGRRDDAGQGLDNPELGILREPVQLMIVGLLPAYARPE